MEWSAPPAAVDAPRAQDRDSGPAPAASDGRGPLRRRRPRLLRVVGAVLVGCLVVAGFVAWRLADDGTPPLTRADVDRAVQQGVAKAQQDQRNTPPDAAVAYRRILPSLVTVTAEVPGGGTGELGSGVVVRADGSVMTALHVVEPAPGGAAPTLRVRFSDGTAATAKVASRQPDQDVAVLSVDALPQVVVPAVLGGGVQVGDPVFPVGAPLGLEGSLTAGVVSALDRTVTTEKGGKLAGLIQFDAAVNPGNSGGPLLDRDGQVVGLVTGLANPSAQKYFVGIGFAVPISTAGGGAGLPPH